MCAKRSSIAVDTVAPRVGITTMSLDARSSRPISQ